MNQTFNDISFMQGVYSDFLVSNGKLIAFVEVEGINLDLEDDATQTSIFESYEAFLLSVISKKESFMNMTMAVKSNMTNFILYWKRKYLETEKMNLDKDVKYNRLNYIASKILEYEEHASLYEMSSKKHFLIIKEDIKNNTQVALEEAEDELRNKVGDYIESMKEAMAQANQKLSMEMLDSAEITGLLRMLIDNKSVIYL